MTSGSFFADLTSFLGRIEEESMSMKEALFSSVSGDSGSLRNSLSVFDEQIFGRGEIDGGQLTKRDASIIERALAKREDTRREMILEAAELEVGLTAMEEAVNKLSSQREATRACFELLEFNEGALNDLEERSMAYGYNRRQLVNVSPKQNNIGTEEGVYSSTTTHEDVVQNRDGQQQQQQSHSIVSDEQQCRISLHEGGGEGDGMENVLVVSHHQIMIGQDECCDEGSEAGEGEPKTPTLSEWAVSRHTRSILKPSWGNGGECNPSVPVRSLRSLALTERIATPMPNKDASHDLEFTTPTDNNQPYINQDNDASDSDPPTPVVIDIGLKTTSLQKELNGNRLSTETNSTNSSSTPASKIVHALSPMKTPHHRSMLENSTVTHNTSDIQNEDVDKDDKNYYLRDSLNVSDSIDLFSTPSTHRHTLQGASSAANLPASRSCQAPGSTMHGTATPFPQDHHPGDTADVDDASTPQMLSPPKVSVMRVEDLENLASACPLKKVVDLVSEEEYASTPKFLTLQVTRDVLNTMVEKLNQYTTIHPSTDEWLLSGDEMVEVMNAEAAECGGDDDANKTDEKYDEKYCKTVLLSLIHLKRLQMRGGGVIRYEILRSKVVPT